MMDIKDTIGNINIQKYIISSCLKTQYWFSGKQMIISNHSTLIHLLITHLRNGKANKFQGQETKNEVGFYSLKNRRTKQKGKPHR